MRCRSLLFIGGFFPLGSLVTLSLPVLSCEQLLGTCKSTVFKLCNNILFIERACECTIFTYKGLRVFVLPSPFSASLVMLPHVLSKFYSYSSQHAIVHALSYVIDTFSLSLPLPLLAFRLFLPPFLSPSPPLPLHLSPYGPSSLMQGKKLGSVVVCYILLYCSKFVYLFIMLACDFDL